MVTSPELNVDQNHPANDSSEELDPGLLGHWRHTNSEYSDGFSIVTDTHFIFSQNGTFRTYSRIAGSFGSSQHAGESGRWRTSNKVLYLQYDTGYREAYPYTVYPDRVFLPTSHQRLWTRIE